ncbi:hypothetical protein LCI18_011281 [Fusarium solani-melongenae]|uniref:Uncharacterized protein n=1 Tax=Fusarium solani subsp. cucurbitae TaxID=2747967 RepID=A0ACD3ZGK5_FUSSC|nr:hypothetical protein LCI18_011281 [Fusarium solani-melongenae]
MAYKSVALVGASGNLGQITLPAFLESDLEVTAIVRSTSTATFPESIKVIKTEYNLADLTEALKGKDAVISMIPIVSLDQQAVVIDAAIAAGVKRFIPSEFGSDTRSEKVLAAVPFFKVKKDYLDLLKTKEDVISWTALFTGPFFDWGLPLGFWGFDLANKKALLVDEGKATFTTSNALQIGRALVGILKHPEETSNTVVAVESFTTTQLKALEILEKVTNTTFERKYQTSDELRAEAFKLLNEGNINDGGAKLISALVFGKENLEDHKHLDLEKWNKLLGLPTESVEETIESVIKSLA